MYKLIVTLLFSVLSIPLFFAGFVFEFLVQGIQDGYVAGRMFRESIQSDPEDED